MDFIPEKEARQILAKHFTTADFGDYADIEADIAFAVRKARLIGIADGLSLFAWWKDGIQYVGTCGTTLKEALAKYGPDTTAD
jgi:hypothetical protein